MDLNAMQIPLIFVVFFLVAIIILGLVYKFGMKEKSYEEALAEQRQTNHTLLNTKIKPKDKKIKKNNKKPKEKDVEDKKLQEEKNDVKSILKTDKLGVEIKQKQETKPKIKFNKVVEKGVEEFDSSTKIHSVPKEQTKEKPVATKKQEPGKVNNKENVSVQKKDHAKKEIVKEKVISNKKEELIQKEITKDKQSNKKDELVVSKNEDQTVNKEEIEFVKKEDNTALIETSVEKKEETPVEAAPIEKIQVKQLKSNNIQSREKREVEEKVNTVKTSLTNGYVIGPTKDKKKKKNELNALQQLTAAPGGPGMPFVLNMVHKAELSHADIQVLIELLLNKQLDAPSILEEWSEGKSDPVQKLKKQLAEKEKALIDEQETLLGVQIKLKEIRNEQLAERSVLNQKIKVLEEQLQGHQMEIHACNGRYHAQSQQLQQVQVQLNEERMKLHSMREELGAVQMQRQQLEMHIAQESEVMIAQLRADLQEFSASNEQLLIDLNHIQKVAAEKEASYIGQLNNLTQNLADKTRQIEELSMDLANKNELLYRQEGELKTEIAQLNALMQQQAEEIRKTEQGKEELTDEINNLKKQKNISNKVINQLKSEIEKLQEERSKNEASMENNKMNETEVLNLKNELASVKNIIDVSEKKYMSELKAKTELMNKLETELDEQKTKNNELRNKNYKIMEALNAAESRIKNGQIENSNEKKSLKDKTAEIESQKKFLSRLLPEVNGLEDVSSEKWEEECLIVVSNYLESLRQKNMSSEPTDSLQARIDHYQSVIKDTEGMLSKLQAHIDQEQISWKAQIKSKDLELEALKAKLEKTQKLENLNGSSVEGQ